MTEEERDSRSVTGGPSTDEPDSESPTLHSPGGLRPALESAAPQIPNYRILDRIGTGGMGEVWSAEQERPIRRKVALKVIKLGMDSLQVVARFEYERRALALMSHPNIAAVYEAGTTPDGRPYLAMEYVPGESVTTYCRRHRLAIRERLELFLKICDGVQHAHQKGIIHRDLKPSNVLVTIQEQEAVPKIVDFGLAKATAQHLTEETMHTAIGVLIGTIEYMSPEQLDPTGLDVDTRSDIYSLGVILYKLLVGSVPFEKGELLGSGFDALRRVICEEEPSRPSTRLSHVHETAPEIAIERSQQHATLVKRIRGDLDWITLKALEKDRTRRYRTVNALAMDIRRHLANEPVVARPPSTVYKVQKFVRRHRAGVAAALVVALALVGGAIGTTAGLLRALRAERRATLEAETARQVSDFLVELFRFADPDETQGESITAREILDEGSQRISRELRQQPTTQARLMNTMGTVYRHLGLYEESQTLLEEALALRRSQLGDDTVEVAESLADLAELDLLEGRFSRAQAQAERALAIRESALARDSPEVADSLVLLGWILANQSKHVDAIAHFERALRIRESVLGADSTGVAESQHGLGFSYWQLGEYDPAEQALRRALETYERVLGRADSRAGRALNDLAAFYQGQGRHREALPLLQRALAIKERVVGPGHPDVALSLNNLAIAYAFDDRPTEAEALFQRALGILESAHGADHHLTALGLANLAWINYRQGELDEAEALYERAFSTYRRTIGLNDRNVGILLQDWSQLHADRGQLAEAGRLLEQAAEIWEAAVGPDHPRLAECLDLLADLYAQQGKLSEAEPLYRRVLSIREARLGADHPATVQTRRALSGLRQDSGRLGDGP